MRVLRLPEGSRTRSISLVVNGERVALEFNNKGEVRVLDEQADAVIAACPALTLVKPDKPKAPKKEVAEEQEDKEIE